MPWFPGVQEYFQRAAAVYIDLPGTSSIFDAGPSKVRELLCHPPAAKARGVADG